MKLSGIAIRPLFGSRACAAITKSSSDLSRTDAEIASTAKRAAAALKGFSQYSVYGADAGLNSIATLPTRGAISLSISTHLPALRRLRNVEPGNIAAGSREARDEAAADRIGKCRKNDGDSVRLLQQGRRDGCGARNNEVGL